MKQTAPTFDLGTDNLTTDDPAVVMWMHAFTANDQTE
jgi:hypothetical protein